MQDCSIRDSPKLSFWTLFFPNGSQFNQNWCTWEYIFCVYKTLGYPKLRLLLRLFNKDIPSIPPRISLSEGTKRLSFCLFILNSHTFGQPLRKCMERKQDLSLHPTWTNHPSQKEGRARLYSLWVAPCPSSIRTALVMWWNSELIGFECSPPL